MALQALSRPNGPLLFDFSQGAGRLPLPRSPPTRLVSTPTEHRQRYPCTITPTIYACRWLAEPLLPLTLGAVVRLAWSRVWESNPPLHGL